MRKAARKMISILIAVCVSIIPLSVSAAQVDDFTDLPHQPWYYDYLYRATNLGLFSGTSSVTFSPEREITRAEAVMVLSRVHEQLTGEKITASSNMPFRDVSSKSYYYKAVSWAAENKIVSGYGKGTFGPNNKITHAELAVMFHKYLKLVGKDSLYQSDDDVYMDLDQIPSWAIPHVQAISGFNIFQGEEFAPQTKTMRSEAVALFVRMYEKASYPVDSNTPRQKYAYTLSTDDNGDLIPFLPWGENQKKIISNYEEYKELQSFLEKSDNCNKVEQSPSLEISEDTFSNHVLLAIAVQKEGTPAFDCEFGGISVRQDTAQITLIESGLGGSTAGGKGVVFFLLVPQAVEFVETIEVSWTEDTNWTPS